MKLNLHVWAFAHNRNYRWGCVRYGMVPDGGRPLAIEWALGMGARRAIGGH